MSEPRPPLLLDLFEPQATHAHTLPPNYLGGHDQGASHWQAVGRAQRLEAAFRQIVREEVTKVLEGVSVRQ